MMAFTSGQQVIIGEAVAVGATFGGAGSVVESRIHPSDTVVVKVELDQATALAAGPHWRYAWLLPNELHPA